MGRFLWRWILFAVALILAAKATGWAAATTGWFVSGFEIDPIQNLGGGLKLLGGAAVLALLNATLGKVIKFLALPITCLTLGLFSLVINAAMLMLAGTLELGFRVDNFAAALVGSVILSIVNALLGILIPDEDEKD